MLDQQEKEISIAPIQPEPVIQTLEIKNIEKVKLEDNTGLSSVLKRQSKDSLTVEEAQSNNIIETHSQINSVSINSEPVLQFTGKQTVFSSKGQKFEASETEQDESHGEK